jgi:hypothetical protein
MKYAAGGELEVIEYPINMRLPRYNRLPIANVGEHHPTGWFQDGGVWKPDQAYFEDLASVYDPLQFVAIVDEGHPNPWAWFDDPGERPALGLISALYAEGQGDDAQLLADLVNLDPLLADEIDAGRWPNRSIEWVDAYDDYAWLKSHRPPDELPELESLFFYGRYARYLTGLALLGRSWPAVFGLGPWPSRSQDGNADGLIKLPAARREITPRAASQADTRHPRVFSLIPTNEQEGQPMAGDKAQGTESPPEKGGSVTTATVEPAVQTETATESVEQATTAAAGASGDFATRAELEAAQAENRKLSLQLAAKNRDDEVRQRLSAHLRSGRLTAQNQRAAYTRLASQLFGQQPGKLMQASGQETQLDVSPLDDLDAIIREFPVQASMKLVADEDPGASDSDKNSATDRDAVIRAYMKEHDHSSYKDAAVATAGGTRNG